MPPKADWRGAGRGQVEQLYTVRCYDCRDVQNIRALDGVLDVTLAVRWAREAGWSLGRDRRWRCSACAKTFRGQQRVARKARAH
jgi:hypothetical protein